MAKLVIPVEQHLDRLPPTVVIQATTWWETAIIHAELQECGLVVHLPVRVCCYWRLSTIMLILQGVYSVIHRRVEIEECLVHIDNASVILRCSETGKECIAWYTLIMQVSFLGVLKLGRSALPGAHCFYMTVALFLGLNHFI